MNKYLVGLLVGVAFTGSLFQFDFNLPSYSKTAHNKLLKKHDKVKRIVKSRRDKLSVKAAKKTGKRAAAALVPFAGVVIITSLSVQEYCKDLESNIELSNIVNDKNERFDNDECYKQAKDDAIGVFDLIEQWWSNE